MNAVKEQAQSALGQAMTQLTAQWYNAVVNNCGLDPQTFQLVQGNQVIGSTSELLWKYFDAIPPWTLSNFYNPTTFNSFSQDYGGVVDNLIPQGADELQSAMGDYYSQWLAYAKSKQDYSVEAFQAWAMGVDPSQAADWVSLYRTLFDGAIFLAQQAWDAMLHAKSHPGVAAYDKTIEELKSQIASAPSKTFHMDSKTESTDVSNTWAEGALDGILDDFFAGGESSYSAFAESIVKQGLKIDVSFSNLMTFPAGPLSQPSSDPVLGAYTPWYNSDALSIAYKNNNNRVWKHGAPTWEGTFGADGDMRRVASALVVVDGLKITMTSDVSIEKSSQQKFEAAAAGGFFPFFEAEGASGWETSTHFEDEGHVTVQSESPTGNPVVLGVIVTPMAEVLK